MTFFNRTTASLAAVALAGSLLGGVPALGDAHRMCPNPAFVAPKAPSVTEQLKPLADLLASAEGNYNSVNRGWAGDTPGGMTSLTGRDLTTYTVGQVMSHQQGWLHAVGRYQFIPTTLRFAVDASAVNTTQLFSEEVQDQLMAALIAYKRPHVLTYLQGNHNDLDFVIDELSREWASVEYRYGASYHAGIGGNRAKITRAQVAKVLRELKANWNSRGVLP